MKVVMNVGSILISPHASFKNLAKTFSKVAKVCNNCIRSNDVTVRGAMAGSTGSRKSAIFVFEAGVYV